MWPVHEGKKGGKRGGVWLRIPAGGSLRRGSPAWLPAVLLPGARQAGPSSRLAGRTTVILKSAALPPLGKAPAE
jgi:hypothetical protein